MSQIQRKVWILLAIMNRWNMVHEYIIPVMASPLCSCSSSSHRGSHCRQSSKLLC
jgi:DUF1365 family protein